MLTTYYCNSVFSLFNSGPDLYGNDTPDDDSNAASCSSTSVVHRKEKTSQQVYNSLHKKFTVIMLETGLSLDGSLLIYFPFR